MRLPVLLSDEERRVAYAAAEQWAAEYDLRARCEPYRALAYRGGKPNWPVLQIDDLGGIPFLDDVVGVEFYQLRACVRARQGDITVATCPNLVDYERYNADYLQLGRPEFVHALPQIHPLHVSDACRQGIAFKRLCARAREAGGLVIHPYMGIEAVWELGRAISLEASVPVEVLAPPPPVTWLANDKVALTALVTHLGRALPNGPEVVSSEVATSADELTHALLSLAEEHPRVALKMPRCASAMGNEVFDSQTLRGMSREAVQGAVERFLSTKRWNGSAGVLAVSWESVSSSPSSQLWLDAEGTVHLNGLYEQLLEGEQGVFLGSIPSRLGPEVDTRLGRDSVLIATVFQRLGYVGRCSFDFIVARDRPFVVECNGRWGGTSTPMALVDRLFPQGRPAYRARDVTYEGLVGAPFEVLRRRLGETLYDARTGKGQFILYNVGCLTGYGKFDVIALGATVAEATEALESRLPVLLA